MRQWKMSALTHSFLQNWSVSSYNNYEMVNSEDFMWG